MLSVLLTTNGADVTIPDLGGKFFPHPTYSYEMIGEFTYSELSASEDLQNAVTAGTVILLIAGQAVSDVWRIASGGESSGGGGGGSSVWEDSIKVDTFDSEPISGPEYVKIINQSMVVPETGTYGWELSYNYEVSKANKYFLSRLFINGVQVNLHKEEVKDVGNLLGYLKKYEVDLTAGPVPIVFEAATSHKNTQAQVSNVIFELRKK